MTAIVNPQTLVLSCDHRRLGELMGSGEKKRTKTIRYKHCITGSKLCSLVSRYLYHSIQLRLSFFSFLLSFQQLSSSFERSSSSRILLSLSSLSVFLVFPLFSNPSHALRSSTFPPHAVFVLCAVMLIRCIYLIRCFVQAGRRFNGYKKRQAPPSTLIGMFNPAPSPYQLATTSVLLYMREEKSREVPEKGRGKKI